MVSLLVFMVFNETLPGLDELNVSSYWKGGIPLGLGKAKWAGEQQRRHQTWDICEVFIRYSSLGKSSNEMDPGKDGTIKEFTHVYWLVVWSNNFFSEGLEPPISLPMVCVLAMRICTKQLGANAEYLRLSIISSHCAGRFIQVTPHVMNLYVCHGNLQTLLGW